MGGDLTSLPDRTEVGGITEGEFLATLEEIGWLDAVPPEERTTRLRTAGGECVHSRSKVCLLRGSPSPASTPSALRDPGPTNPAPTTR